MLNGFFNPDSKSNNFGIEGKTADRTISRIDDFLEAGNMNHYVKKVQARHPILVNDQGDPSLVENQYFLIRSTDNRIVSPKTVSDQYTPLSLIDLAEELQYLCDQGWATPDAVYTAKNESMECLALRFDLGDDEEEFTHYLFVSNQHGVGGTAKGKIITFRPCCENISGSLYRSRDIVMGHRVASGDHDLQNEIMKERITFAVSTWKQVQDHVKALSEKVNTWKDMPLAQNDFEEMTNNLLGIRDIEKASGKAVNRRDAILAATKMPQFGTEGKTVYDWYNAVTFTNSSPNAEVNKKSKVSPIDRLVRNTESTGTGFRLESKAVSLIEAM